MQVGGSYSLWEDKDSRKREDQYNITNNTNNNNINNIHNNINIKKKMTSFINGQESNKSNTNTNNVNAENDSQQDNMPVEDPLHLENTWSFWHDKYIGPSQSVEEYEASLHKLCTFTTIQDFWKNFNNLPTIDKLKMKSSFHLMKAGIRPIWEDPENANGGFWAMRVRREDTEYTWKELVLAAIGEQFGPVLSNEDDICGVTVSLRQYDNIIEVWNANASANVNAVLARIKSIVPNVELRNPFYKAHREHTAFNAAKTQGSHKR